MNMVFSFLKPLLLTVLLVITIAYISPVHANQPTGEDIQKANYLTQRIKAVEKNLDSMLNTVLAGGSIFTKHVGVIFGAMMALALILAIYKYVILNKGIGVILEFVFRALILTLVLSTFGSITSMIWGWGNGVGLAMQDAMIGGTGMMAPAKFIWHVSTLIEFITVDGNIITNAVNIIVSVIIWFVLMVILLIVTVLSYIAAVWPILAYAIAKPIGYFLIPFLFFEKTSELFDGWLRLFLHAVFYCIVSRVVLSVIVMVFSAYFQIGYSPSLPAILKPIVLVGTGLFDIIAIIVICLVSILALLGINSMVATIVNGSAFGNYGGGGRVLGGGTSKMLNAGVSKMAGMIAERMGRK